MINLLPPELKAEYRYARRNSRLLYVIAIFFLGFAGLAVIVAAGVLYIEQSANSYASEVSGLKQSLKDQKQEEVNAEAQDISNSLKLAVRVLSQQVLFSKLLEELAPIIPEHVTLSGITLNELQGALNITADATNYESATQLQVNMSDPNNKIFSKADIIDIRCSTGDTKDAYPCTVSIRVEFGDSKRFLFIYDEED